GVGLLDREAQLVEVHRHPGQLGVELGEPGERQGELVFDAGAPRDGVGEERLGLVGPAAGGIRLVLGGGEVDRARRPRPAPHETHREAQDEGGTQRPEEPHRSGQPTDGSESMRNGTRRHTTQPCVDGAQEKVSHRPGSPESNPRCNHSVRCSAEPWVHVSGFTIPVAWAWIRSSPTAAAASRASAISPGSISIARSPSTVSVSSTRTVESHAPAKQSACNSMAIDNWFAWSGFCCWSALTCSEMPRTVWMW